MSLRIRCDGSGPSQGQMQQSPSRARTARAGRETYTVICDGLLLRKIAVGLLTVFAISRAGVNSADALQRNERGLALGDLSIRTSEVTTARKESQQQNLDSGRYAISSSRKGTSTENDSVTGDRTRYQDVGVHDEAPTEAPPVFSNEFVVKMPGSVEDVKRLAELHGYYYLGSLPFDNLHHVRHRRLVHRSIDLHPHNESEPWEERIQQKIKVRTKRDYGGEENVHLWQRWQRQSDETIYSATGRMLDGSYSRDHLPRTSVRQKRAPQFKPERERTRMNDPKWPLQWYLNRGGGLDMNVERAWAEFNVSGKGVVVTILDDGLEKDHPDIQENYDPDASYDMNDQDPDPQPRYEQTDMNRHGTRCAGEVAGIRDNQVCGVGIAYGASIGGIRMLDGDVTDAVEARSLSLNSQHVHVYSASWGPDDDAKTVDGPGQLADRALKDGIRNGRKGLGSIFVWASGNGGKEKDNCNCDGYVNSIYTLAVSAATENGNVPWYSESCAASLATTYSSGNYNEGQIVTSDLHHNCTERHTGTSASAPLAAAIVALALESNPSLTWRDMQHLAVRATKRANLNAPDWVTNGVGRNVSHSFGFGLLDAHRMVELAKRWRRSPPQKVCTVSTPRNDRAIPPKSTLLLHLYVECKNVKHIEHTISKISLQAVRRGDLHIYLTSPKGTKSTLLTMRPRDDSRQGFNQWPFMTVHNWGEDPNGNWTLEIHNEGAYLGKATLREWALILYGTAEDPEAQLRSDFPDKLLGEIDQGNDLGGNEGSSGVRSTGVRDPAIDSDTVLNSRSSVSLSSAAAATQSGLPPSPQLLGLTSWYQLLLSGAKSPSQTTTVLLSCQASALLKPLQVLLLALLCTFSRYVVDFNGDNRFVY
ncbi:furin-like protease 1, isoforms 1/1-X/2 isoform X4 [Varroa destructor]|uniref:furin n=1 Tax=Varroa destructor TaxID=109461 RepID=A0A7M7K7X8_VARDE|nr:furin-like protease 1, isoforms 1/1-X/2 isoform X4 [Varroa destructor]